MHLGSYVITVVPLITLLMCKNDVATLINAVNGNIHRTLIMDRSMNVCSDIDCIPCKIIAMSTIFNLPILSIAKCAHSYDVETPEPTNVSFKATPTKKRQCQFLSHSGWKGMSKI